LVDSVEQIEALLPLNIKPEHIGQR